MITKLNQGYTFKCTNKECDMYDYCSKFGEYCNYEDKVEMDEKPLGTSSEPIEIPF